MALPSDPYPGRVPGSDPQLLDSFLLNAAGVAPCGDEVSAPRVLSLSLETPAPEGFSWTALRGVIGSATTEELAPAFRALSLANWRASSKFCGRCGSPQTDKPDETARLCPRCGSVTYPRLSPAVLALVRKEGRVLLARNVAFRSGVFSILAGFVEPGESFEECVVREVREEVGIRVGRVRYLGSQPWPFPDSLMVGFEAEWEAGDLRPDGVEIAEAGWYGPDDHPPLPLPGSLSRRLIDGAFGR